MNEIEVKHPIWFAKYVTFKELAPELDAFSVQGYGIVKIELTEHSDFLIIAKMGYVGNIT